MNELVVITEGQTEQTFVRDQLSGHLAIHGTLAWAVLPGRRRNAGGVRSWEGAKQDITRTLREQRYCTTMIDYYGMPYDWPGRPEAQSLPWNQRASTVEQQLKEAIELDMGSSWNPKFFIPYVQLHEFEALAFADIEVLVSVIAALATDDDPDELTAYFQKILSSAGDPEAINDQRDTCPSRRISGKVAAYRKPVLGPIITKEIGLDTLREKCRHFGLWLSRLEQIGGST